MNDSSTTGASPFMAALEQFEATEANLVKLERVWSQIQAAIQSSVTFGENAEYDDRLRSFSEIAAALPLIDGWKPNGEFLSLDEIAQNRLDAMELGEPEVTASVEASIAAPEREIAEYRYRLNSKRSALIRDALVGLIDAVDEDLRSLREASGEAEPGTTLKPDLWEGLKDHIAQIGVLLGSSVPAPPRWIDMRRHMHFGMVGDLDDIEQHDWPAIKASLRAGLYGENEPLPIETTDLADLVQAKPQGSISTGLDWGNLDDDGYERLLFALISSVDGYENPEWLMRTRAPDRGRDLSVTRVTTDALSGTTRQRIVIQCKHWLSKSVGLPEASTSRDQMALWKNPRVDVLVIATSGRFTSDAVTWIEDHNASGIAPKIEMWPESHLERLLAERPAMIADFRLR